LAYFLINIYSDSSQTALKYLKNTKVDINNVLIIAGDFNIRDSSWDPNFPHYSQHSSDVFDITNSLHLELSRPTKQIPTRYLDNQQDSNSVIDLMFLRLEYLKHDNYTIYPDWRLSSDYVPFTVNISIFKEYMLVENSKNKDKFINKLIKIIKGTNMENIQNKDVLNQIV